MRNHLHGFRNTVSCALSIALLAASARAQQREYRPRNYYGATMELPDGIMHGVGQLGSWKGEQQHINDYMSIVGESRPCLFMVYAGIRRDTMPHPAYLRVMLDTMDALERRYADTKLIPQLGLYIVDFVDALEKNEAYRLGGFDTLIAIMNESARPWYVRIGYEFNGNWNGYEPAAYRSAYGMIAERFRERATVPVANVWCYHPTNAKHMDYYPGDSIVDWWSIDLFEKNYLGAVNTRNFLDDADAHGKPVMIGEATPSNVQVNDGRQDWDAWFDPYFQLLADYPVIKAFTYINWDWTITRWPGWGDCRIEHNDTISSLWRRELSNPIFRHGPYDPAWFEETTGCMPRPPAHPSRLPESGLRVGMPGEQRFSRVCSYCLSGRRLPGRTDAKMVLLDRKAPALTFEP